MELLNKEPEVTRSGRAREMSEQLRPTIRESGIVKTISRPSERRDRKYGILEQGA